MRLATRAMKAADFDREAFKEKLLLPAVRAPARQSSELRKRLSPYLLSLKKIRPVVPDKDGSTKLILLDDKLRDSIPSEVIEATEEAGGEVTQHELTVGYERMTASEVLRKVLPPDVVVPSAFESAGQVAHLNLKPEHEPYKHIIGQVLLDKNKAIRTVINKVGTLENEYRSMEYEVLAGDPSLETTVKQGGYRYKLDFGKVYWNSRLEFEHGRMVGLFKKSEVVLDLMAGIGPFAVPAARKGCLVIANDKNPESYKWLVKNIWLNKVPDMVIPFNMDARECLDMVTGKDAQLIALLPEGHVSMVKQWVSRERRQKKGERESTSTVWSLPSLPLRFDHVVMNYPQNAIGFLDMFRSSFDSEFWSQDDMPYIHCYAFMRSDEDEKAMLGKCEESLGGEIREAIVHFVRQVAPNKAMCCISFRLPWEIANELPGNKRKHDVIDTGTVDY